MRARMKARISENERMSESEAAHGRGSYGPASEVVSERKSAAEKEQALLTTERCSKRKAAHARVNMSWCACLILVVACCVLATVLDVAFPLQLWASPMATHAPPSSRHPFLAPRKRLARPGPGARSDDAAAQADAVSPPMPLVRRLVARAARRTRDHRTRDPSGARPVARVARCALGLSRAVLRVRGPSARHRYRLGRRARLGHQRRARVHSRGVGRLEPRLERGEPCGGRVGGGVRARRGVSSICCALRVPRASATSYLREARSKTHNLKSKLSRAIVRLRVLAY